MPLGVSLYALDAATGERRWRVPTGLPSKSMPAVDGETVFFAGEDTYVYALDAATGAERWRTKTDGQVDANVTLTDETVCVATEARTVYALDRESGAVRWTYRFPSNTDGHGRRPESLATDGARVYVLTDDRLTALSAEARTALYSGRVSVVTYAVGGGLALIGLVAGALGVSALPDGEVGRIWYIRQDWLDALGLERPDTRQAAREALADRGSAAIDSLARHLLDERVRPGIRRHIPSVLARIPDTRSVDVMLHSVIATETDQLLDYRTLKALSQLRLRHPDLHFDPTMVMDSLRRELHAAARYDRARRCLNRIGASGPAASLLIRSLEEAWTERQEGVFRLLGMLYDPDEMYRCRLALTSGDRTVRANAVEWLEESLDRPLFEELGPVIGEGVQHAPLPDPGRSVAPLLEDGDPWIARLSVALAGEIDAAWSRAALRDIIDTSTSEEICELARRLLAPREADGARMDLIEKVFLLQKIDLLRDARNAHLALLASIAEEVDAQTGAVLIREGEPTDALYVVVDGAVDLIGVEDQRMQAVDGDAFGTWALIDEAPSLVTATVREPTRLLRITRGEFYDLLADHSELALGLLQGLARRVRGLVA